MYDHNLNVRNTQRPPVLYRLNENNNKVTHIFKITSDDVVTKEVRRTILEGMNKQERIKSYQQT